MNSKAIHAVAALLWAVADTGLAQTEAPAPRACTDHILSVSSSGMVTAGSRAALAAAVERGDAVRVGFGLGRGATWGYFLTHWFDAKFLTVLGEDVFTQTPMIHRQRPDPKARDITLNPKSSVWVATLGTNGVLHSRFMDEDEVSTHRVDSWWCRA